MMSLRWDKSYGGDTLDLVRETPGAIFIEARISGREAGQGFDCYSRHLDRVLYSPKLERLKEVALEEIRPVLIQKGLFRP